jgi:MFS family permease
VGTASEGSKSRLTPPRNYISPPFVLACFARVIANLISLQHSSDPLQPLSKLSITMSDNTKQTLEHLEHLEKTFSKDSLHRNELGQDAADLQSYWSSPRLLGSILASFLLANSIYIGYALPVSIISVINADIGPSPNIYLISLVYTLFTGVLHLFFARLSDILGRRYFLVGGQTFGVVGSIICATGNNVNVLIGGSVLAGIGGAAGLLYPVVIHELLPNKHRHWGQAAITLSVLPTLGFGPAIARTMIAQTSVGWRGVYWLNVAVSGASVVLFATCYFPPNFHMINSELTKWQEVKALDYGVRNCQFPVKSFNVC